MAAYASMARAERHHSGFSLLELLVALAVFSLAALALLRLGAESTRSAAIVEQRLLADIVAENRAVEAATLPLAQLQAAREGNEEQGGLHWHWQRELIAAGDGLMQVRVGVRAGDSGQVLAERSLLRSTP